jgi:hypothetical protein
MSITCHGALPKGQPSKTHLIFIRLDSPSANGRMVKQLEHCRGESKGDSRIVDQIGTARAAILDFRACVRLSPIQCPIFVYVKPESLPLSAVFVKHHETRKRGESSFVIDFPPPSAGEVSASYADGGGSAAINAPGPKIWNRECFLLVILFGGPKMCPVAPSSRLARGNPRASAKRSGGTFLQRTAGGNSRKKGPSTALGTTERGFRSLRNCRNGWRCSRVRSNGRTYSNPLTQRLGPVAGCRGLTSVISLLGCNEIARV